MLSGERWRGLISIPSTGKRFRSASRREPPCSASGGGSSSERGDHKRPARRLAVKVFASSHLTSSAKQEMRPPRRSLALDFSFVGTAAFCLLSLLSPDSALLSDIERINVPFAGPVSSYGFMIIGPLVLIVLRVYLQIYVEHSSRLDRLAQSVSVVRPPTLVPLENSWIRLFSGLVFYALLPAIMLCFAWKAAVLPKSALFTVVTTLAIGVIAYHEMLLSWRPKGLLTASVAIIVGGIIFGFLSPRRFNLYRANLSDHRSRTWICARPT